MLMFNPWYLSCVALRLSGDIWARNVKAMQVFTESGLQQAEVFAGLSHPGLAPAGMGSTSAAQAKSVLSSSPTRKPPRRQPSAPPPMPDSDVSLEDADLPV